MVTGSAGRRNWQKCAHRQGDPRRGNYKSNGAEAGTRLGASQEGPQGLGGGGRDMEGQQDQGSRGRLTPRSPRSLCLGPSGTSAGLQTWQPVPKTPKLEGRIGWSLWALGFHSNCAGKPPKASFF